MIRRTLTSVILVTGVLCSTPLRAHYPTMQCEAVEQLIRCEVGFSDGSKAVGKPVRLFSYDEDLLQTRKSDRFSRVEFERPKGDFYLQFDSGHEFPIEVDMGEL